MALAGALACQRDSYLKELTTTVKSCEPATLPTVTNGKKTKLSCYGVILEDTILFPEGGGQPDDHGTIGGVEVLRILRQGGDAVHYVPVPLDQGSEVVLKVDWQRRFDHMQQHSGQHLVTAVADSMFGYPTVSWWLGEKMSTIELGTPSISVEEMQRIEDAVNEKIRSHVPMYPTIYEDKNSPEVQEVRTRGLPEDHVGPVRIVTIEGVEANMCCGTHVSNLSHLQAIKILGTEKGKKGKTINIVFLAGNRLLQYAGKCFDREKTLTSMLKGGPDDHVELLNKVQNSFKVAQKSCTTLLRDIAVLEARQFLSKADRGPLMVLHRKEGDNEFMNIIANEINDENVVKFLTVGDEKGAGLFLLSGTEELVSQVADKVLQLLEGKGANKKGRLQGKANKLSKRPEVVSLLQAQLGLS